MNTIEQRLKIDADNNQIRMIVNTLYHHILHNYIAPANERQVLDNLYKFYTESDVTLISKQQLRVYQELDKYSLNLSAFNITKEK